MLFLEGSFDLCTASKELPVNNIQHVMWTLHELMVPDQLEQAACVAKQCG